MNAGIPDDPGKLFQAGIDALGQVTFSPSNPQQSMFQETQDHAASNAGATAVESITEGRSNAVQNPISSVISRSTVQGVVTPTLNHLPVEAPPATQLSPSAPTSVSLDALGTQVAVPLPSRSASISRLMSVYTPGSSISPHPTTASSRGGSTSAVQQSFSLPRQQSSSIFLTTSFATAVSVASVSIGTSKIVISSKTTKTSSVLATSSTLHSQSTTSLVSKVTTSVPTRLSTLVSTSVSTVVAKASSAISSSMSTSLSLSRSSAVSVLAIQSTSTSISSSPSQSQSLTNSSAAPSYTPSAAQSSSLNVHDPPFYVGIALGVIAAVAFVAVLIAWCIRFRRASNRRRIQNPTVPWATDEEQGTISSGRTAQAARNLGSLDDLAHMRAWEPRGDRDAGEPRRAEGNPFYSLQDSQAPPSGIASEESLPSSFDSTAPLQSPGALRPRNTLRQLPSHLVNAEMAGRAQLEGYFRRWHGQKRESLDPHVNPYIGIEKNDYDPSEVVNEAPGEAARLSLADRLRKVGKPPTEIPSEPHWDRLPTPGKDQPTQEFEPWAASIRASLATAFNTISGLSSRDDKFTMAPAKQKLRLSRTQSNSRESSKEWSLEEKEDGTGVVHFLPPLEKDSEWTNPAPGSKATPPNTSLAIPAKLVLKRDSRIGRNTSRAGPGRMALSRESSIYSTVSAQAQYT